MYINLTKTVNKTKLRHLFPKERKRKKEGEIRRKGKKEGRKGERNGGRRKEKRIETIFFRSHRKVNSLYRKRKLVNYLPDIST